MPVIETTGRSFGRPGGGMAAFEIVGETGTSALFNVSFVVAMLDLSRN